MIVDSSVHYVRPGGPSSGEPLSYDELTERAKAVGIDAVVQITPRVLGFDNEYSLEGAVRRPDAVAGVFGRFDVFGAEMPRRLEAYAAQQGMLGVRLTFTDREEESSLRDRIYDPFFREAERIGVAVLLYAPYQAEEMRALARRFPALKLLVDHMGVRYNDGHDNSEPYRTWEQVLGLAREPNVWIKVSYFPEASMDIERYPYPIAQRHLRMLYEHVGASRLVWGSNYPPVQRACTYLQALDFVRLECSFLTAEEKSAVLGGNFIEQFSSQGQKS